jgi:NDP-sugar pyrophosphorylase family protein
LSSSETISAGHQCVILAGGLGTRVRHLNAGVPKALLPVNGRPFIDHQLGWLGSHGVEEVVLSIGYLGAQLREHVGSGEQYGLQVRFVDEGEQLRGTAGALRYALDTGALRERFLVTYGDSYLPIDFGALALAFERSSAPALMSVVRNEGRWDKSNTIVEDGVIQLYDKRPGAADAARMQHIDYGLLAFERRLIEERVATGARADLAVVLHALSLEGALAAYEVTERFYEIGSVQGLADLEAFLLTAGKATTAREGTNANEFSNG